MVILDLLLVLASAPFVAVTGYLLVLAAAARRTKTAETKEDPRLRFDVIVPAHDEENDIGATVRSLLSVDYPESLRRVIVVADNCTDTTAARALLAGASVLIRDDPTRIGKGYALDFAFRTVEGEGIADAVAVVDADTKVSPNLLRAFARRIEAGACAVQADYGVANANASWRTRLLVIAMAVFHLVRSLGRERLGLSAGLRGNGMAFTRDVLRRVPHRAHSLVEDVEYGIDLGEAGERVHFAGEARVEGQMASGGPGARTQRLRWERGRAALARARGRELVIRSIRRRDPVLFDLALDLITPPLATLAAGCAVGEVAALARALGPASTSIAAVALAAWSVSTFALVAYVLRGWSLSCTGLRGLAALAWAPAYVAWKLALALTARSRAEPRWVRTAREGSR